MNPDRIRDIKKRLGIEPHPDPLAEFDQFRIRIGNALEPFLSYIPLASIEEFYQVVAEPVKYVTSNSRVYPSRSIILEKLDDERDERRFLFLLQVILELPFVDYRTHILARVEDAIRLSEVNVELTVIDGEAVVRPRGEPILERHLVDEMVCSLCGTALDHYRAALKSYGKQTAADHVKSAESLRRSVEEFLRFKLNNSKGLKANITELLGRLKEDGRDSSVRNVIFQTFACLDAYFNENSKHADGDIDAAENEYLIYQTGLLVRFIARVLSVQE